MSDLTMPDGLDITTAVTSRPVPEDQRADITGRIFGLHFPLRLEPFIFGMAGKLSDDYSGGYWKFNELSNGGFYMAPDSDAPFSVSCENGFEGSMSADALGITVCLYAFSQLSFGGPGEFEQTCANHYHWLREYMLDHPEAASILSAID